MKISLRNFLITLCLLGAFIGVMGRLLIESPETFLQALTLISTVIPFLLAVGTVIWIGFRRRPKWGLFIWGCLLLLTPIVVTVTLTLLWPTRNPLLVLSTNRLIHARLPTAVQGPAVWMELERRLGNSQLSRQEVDEAVAALTKYMQSLGPKGWNQPLPWQNKFLSAAYHGNLISDDVLFNLCDAFFGTQPTTLPVMPFGPMLNHNSKFNLHLHYGNPFAWNPGLGVQLLWAVKDVRIDGKSVPFKQLNSFAQDWIGEVQQPLADGDHEVVAELDCAYVDETTLGGLQPPQAPVATWPKPLKRWTTTVSMPLNVSAPETK
jgi:hypothetical protein